MGSPFFYGKEFNPFTIHYLVFDRNTFPVAIDSDYDYIQRMSMNLDE